MSPGSARPRRPRDAGCPHAVVLAAIGVALLLPATVARAGVNSWSSIGPEGGNVFALGVDPHMPATLYAGTGGGVFKTTDGGGSWRPASRGMPPANVFALAIDPITPSTVYAGTKNSGVFKSEDGGANWTAANAGLPTARVFALAIDPGAPATIYAGTDSGVFRSTDGAASWKAATDGIAAQPVAALAIDPVTPSTLYAGTKSSGVFKSTDGAASWTAASIGLTQTQVLCLAIDPTSPSTVYAGTHLGIFKSTNGASSWVSVGNFGGGSFALAIDPMTPSTVYAGGGGVFRSTNGGQSWAAAVAGIPSPGSTAFDALAIGPGTPETIWAGRRGSGIFRSTNAGVSWTSASAGVVALKTLALGLDPAAPATVYAGTELGLFKSVDGGTTWTQVVVGANVTGVYSLVVLAVSSTILAGTDVGAWKSTDGGASWTLTLNVLVPYAFTVDPASPSTVYAVGGTGPSGPTEGAALKSTDAGSTWINYGGSFTALPVFESVMVNPSSLFPVIVGTDAGVYGIRVNGDGGLSWVTNGALASKVVYALAVDPASVSTIWAGTDNGLFRSTDSGVSWTQVTNGMTATGVYALLFDPASASTAYAGTDGGVFKSTDRGASWTAMNEGLSNLTVFAVAAAPTSPPVLYAGTAGGSAFVFGRPEASVCVADGTTLCLSTNRFRVSADYEKTTGAKGSGHAVPLTEDTGYFWFFDPTNIEVVTKILPFCVNPFNSIWVFAAGLTDVRVTLTYTDTKNGTVVTKNNPQGVAFVPIQDTQAFLTCP